MMEYEHNTPTEEDNATVEEYKTWKKNAPFLYDLVLTHALEWPSLTCQWFPDVESRPDKNYKTQRLLLGTHTNDEDPNYLMIASVQLPNDKQDIDLRRYEETTNEIGGYGAFNDAHIHITQKIVHDGEVNRVRYQYENPNIIASKGRTGEVFIFDRTTYESFPKENEPFNPALRLQGHTQEGYGLAWNPHSFKSNHLISAGLDGIIAHWDIEMTTKENKTLQPYKVYKGHESGVEDISWHMKHDSIFASVGDDRQLMLWDTREEQKAIQAVQDAHAAEINCVDFSPSNEWVLATGSSDKTAGLFDLRYLKTKIHSLETNGEVVQLAWSPHEEAILATASNFNRRVHVWDLARIGDESDGSGPPELLFVHGGHTNNLTDICWNPAVPWMMTSTAEDNMLQTWQIASTIYGQEQHDDSDKMEL